MRNLMAPNIPLALVLLAAVAAVALRAVARRPEAPGTAPASVTVTAGQRQSHPQPAVTTGGHDTTGGEIAKPPAHPSRPANAVGLAQHIFHELHADGRHTSCTVCDCQYGAA